MANPTRFISWQAMVTEADPFFYEDLNQPETYEFSNGRIFYQTLPVYTAGNDISMNQPLVAQDGTVLITNTGQAIAT